VGGEARTKNIGPNFRGRGGGNGVKRPLREREFSSIKTGGDLQGGSACALGEGASARKNDPFRGEGVILREPAIKKSSPRESHLEIKQGNLLGSETVREQEDSTRGERS